MAYTSFKDLTFKKKIEHIWFYYKWYIIAAIFFGFAAFICINQIVTRPNYDITILWAQTDRISAVSIDTSREELEKYCPDFNGDGEVHVDLRFIGLDADTIAVPQQTVSRDPSSQIDNTESEYVDRQLEMTYKMQLMAEFTTGDSFVFILDDAVYKMLVELGGFGNITNKYNHLCDYIEEDRFKLEATPFEYINSLGNNPKYLLVCSESANKSKDAEKFNKAHQFLDEIIDKSHKLNPHEQ